jgi:hypothetical protein
MAEPREEGHAVGWQREDDFFLLPYEVGRDGKGKSGPKVGTGAGTCGVSEKNITFFWHKHSPNCDFYSWSTFLVIMQPNGWVWREG